MDSGGGCGGGGPDLDNPDEEEDDDWQDVDIISEEWGGVTTPMTQITDPHQVKNWDK